MRRLTEGPANSQEDTCHLIANQVLDSLDRSEEDVQNTSTRDRGAGPPGSNAQQAPTPAAGSKGRGPGGRLLCPAPEWHNPLGHRKPLSAGPGPGAPRQRSGHSRGPGRPDLPSDCPVNVGNDDFVVPVPQIDGAFTAARALVLRGDAEHHVVGAVLQLQAFLKNIDYVSSGGTEGPDGGVRGPLHAMRSRVRIFLFFLITGLGHCAVLGPHLTPDEEGSPRRLGTLHADLPYRCTSEAAPLGDAKASSSLW